MPDDWNEREKLAGTINEGMGCLGSCLGWAIAVPLLWLAAAFLLAGLVSLWGVLTGQH